MPMYLSLGLAAAFALASTLRKSSAHFNAAVAAGLSACGTAYAALTLCLMWAM